MRDSAPFHAQPTQGAPKGAAVWLQAQDGVRIRVGYWPQKNQGRGTVIILPGRTEYIEKYNELAGDLAQAGWASIAIDWRGQGLADRLNADPLLGHVEKFSDYQLDLDAALAWLLDQAEVLGLHPPYMMLAHSMGGLIGLGALYRSLPFKAAVFSAPMWGIAMPYWRRPAAEVLSRTHKKIAQDLYYAPTTYPVSYVEVAPFEGNLLTGDAARWQQMKADLIQEPGFALGGPSLRWLREALREARGLLRRPPPDIAMVTSLGGRERIVLSRPIRKRLANWPKGRLDFYPEAQHEIIMEQDRLRAPFLARAIELFEAQR